MGIVGPCKNCADRAVGCHGVCKTYNDYVVENEKAKSWLKEKNSPLGRITDPPPRKGWKQGRKAKRSSRRT